MAFIFLKVIHEAIVLLIRDVLLGKLKFPLSTLYRESQGGLNSRDRAASNQPATDTAEESRIL